MRRSLRSRQIDFKQIAKVCPTFAVTITVASINWQAPIFLLAFASTELESAEFGAASRLLIPVTILMASYANAIQPMLTKYRLESPDTFRRFTSPEWRAIRPLLLRRPQLARFSFPGRF